MKSRKNIKSILITFIIMTMTTLFINISLAGDIVKVTVETANLRKEATVESNILELISIGETVEILEKQGDWYKVSYKGIVGYLRSDLMEQPKVTEEKPQVETAEAEKPKEEPLPQVETKPESQVQTPESTPEIKYKIKVDSKLNIIPSINAIEIAEVKKDQEITIIERLNEWVCIENGMGKGWIRQDKIEEIKTEVVAQAPVVEPKVMYVNSASVNVREGATTQSNIVTNILVNTEIKVYEDVNGWSKIEVTSTGVKGYISSSLLSATKKETSRSISTVRTTPKKVESEPKKPVTKNVPASSNGSQIVSLAKGYIGSRYVYGGTTPKGFDCSGFTQYIFRACGKSINRTAAAQTSNGVAVSKANLQPGDLVMFGKSGINHVGIYIGGGKIVHAANSRQGVRIDTINSGYYNNNYACARRVL